MVLESHGEPRTAAVLALVRGTGRSCVALSGHFDTVTTENYGTLAPLACDPVPLARSLIDDLSAAARNDDEERALDDLVGGSFIPGRGMLDMKSGLAAGLACLERFARQDGRAGNMLFIAVPDEENRSRGMRAVRDALPELVRRWDLRIAAGINLDATSDLGDGSDGRAIYLGTVGKVLPFAFVIGRPTHAGYPLEGVSAHMIAGEIFRSVELDPDLCESVGGELSPPPVCLEAKDLRVHYDVTMPGETWLAFNWLTFERGPSDVLALFRDRVRGALDEALDRIADRAGRYYRAMGARPPDRRQGRVLTFDELRGEALRVGGPDAIRPLRGAGEVPRRGGQPAPRQPHPGRAARRRRPGSSARPSSSGSAACIIPRPASTPPIRTMRACAASSRPPRTGSRPSMACRSGPGVTSAASAT